MNLHIAETICESTCSAEGPKLIVEMSIKEAEAIRNLLKDSDCSRGQELYGLLARGVIAITTPTRSEWAKQAHAMWTGE